MPSSLKPREKFRRGFLPTRDGPRIPPALLNFAMTDRADGKVYWINHDDDKIAIDDVFPPGFKGHTYRQFDGPHIPTDFGSMRLLIRDGAMGYEIVAGITANHPRLYLGQETTDLARTDVFMELFAPVGFRPGGAIIELAYNDAVVFP